MASTQAVSPSQQISDVKIMSSSTITLSASDQDNCLVSLLDSDGINHRDNSSNGSLNGNVKTVSEEDTSSPSPPTDDDHDNEHFLMDMDVDKEDAVDDDHEDTGELLFLQDEEEKLMKDDEELVTSMPEADATITDSELCFLKDEPNTESSDGLSENPLSSNENSSEITYENLPLASKTNVQQESHQEECDIDTSSSSLDQSLQKTDEEAKVLSQGPEKINTNIGVTLEDSVESLINEEMDGQTTKIDSENESAIVPGDNDLDDSENVSQMKATKKVKIAETANLESSSDERRRGLSDATENTDFSLKRNRFDSIDLDSHAFDFEDMDIGLGNTSGIIESESKSSNLPPLGNENNDEQKLSDSVPKNESAEPQNGNSSLRGRGYSLDFFSFGMNEDEPIPPTPYTTVSADLPVSNPGTSDGRVYGNESPNFVADQQISGNSVMTEIDSKQRPRGDSIIFDPSSFGEGGIHEANALERSRRPSISVDEMEIMNAPGFVEPVGPIPDCIESQAHLSSATATQDTTRYPTLLNKQHKTQPQLHPHNAPTHRLPQTNERIENSTSGYAPIPSNKNLTTNNRPLSSLISMSSCTEIILSPDAMSGTSGVLQIDQMELLNQGGRIGLYLPNARKERIAKFHSKRKMRIWRKRIKYDCRKKLADSRPRIKGRFVKRSDVDEE